MEALQGERAYIMSLITARRPVHKTHLPGRRRTEVPAEPTSMMENSGSSHWLVVVSPSSGLAPSAGFTPDATKRIVTHVASRGSARRLSRRKNSKIVSTSQES